MTTALFFEAISKFIIGILLVSVLLFLPAGTLQFSNAWLFMGILFLPMFLAGILMMLKNPGLLKSRLKAKEKQKDQGLLVKLSGLMFLFGFIVSGLGIRYHWYILPQKISYFAAVIFLISYLLYAEVLRENTYLSRTIEVQKGQKVISDGLYGIVRHPMYTATLFLFLSIPLILGSVYAFFLFLIYPFIIVQRIKGEEELLKKELPGYAEYMERVTYRLLPFLW